VASDKAQDRPFRVLSEPAIPSHASAVGTTLMWLSGPSGSQEVPAPVKMLRFSNSLLGSESVAFLTPSVTLTVAGRGFEGFPSEPSSSAEASD
jgi:hypothetical protein